MNMDDSYSQDSFGNSRINLLPEDNEPNDLELSESLEQPFQFKVISEIDDIPSSV